MSRIITIVFIIGFALVVDKMMSTGVSQEFLMSQFGILNDMKFVLVGILVGGIYIFRFGANYSEEGVYATPKNLSDFSVLGLVPGKEYLSKIMQKAFAPLKGTQIGQYFETLYCPPVPSEKVLGGFFFGKTMITTAIAFYEVDSIALISILGFSAVFDSLTGTYQHTLMNYFHRSYFKNKILQFIQNLGKRFAVDIIRAEIIMFLLLKTELLTTANQFHIFKNRLVSASYYFNAVIIDKLVDMGTISRNFRSNFVIVASTIGGMLCLLDFAKTSFPGWVPQELIAAIPASLPGPLQLLMYFNVTVFVIMGGIYLVAISAEKMGNNPEKVGRLTYQKINLILLRIISLLGKF
jgi:hypothetical protein